MATHRHTNVGAAVARTDYLRADQAQDSTVTWLGTAGGTANALTFSVTPAITAYAAGQSFRFIVASNNSASVTVAISGLTAQNLTKNGAVALGTGDLVAGAVITMTYDGTQFQITSGLGTGRLLRRTTYVASTTYTKATDISFVIAYVQAGGGGSAGVPAVASNMGPGAGAGGWSIRKVPASSLATSTTVTVGAAGTAGASGSNLGTDGGVSAFGAAGDVGANVWATATGGTKGPLSVTTFSSSAFGGAGGVGSNGDVNGAGEEGQPAHVSDPSSGRGGSSMGPFASAGGGSRYGGGVAGAAGIAGTGYGSGAGGAVSGTGAAANAGGAGAPGVVILEEYA